MRVLFFMKHPGTVRNFEPLLRALGERGHRIHLAFTTIPTADSLRHVRALAAAVELSYGLAPSIGKAPLSDVARVLRHSIDYLRYLEPRYAEASKLRARAAASAPTILKRALALPTLRRPASVRRLRRLLQAVERAVPPPPGVDSFIREQAPDVVLVTPLVGIGSSQADFLRGARRLGLPTVFPVHSWDNLTNKGLLRDAPDLTIVWNDAQRSEAVELHDVRPETVVVSGAAPFDHWFDWRPTRSRAAFSAEVGLDESEPIVLYVCSSPFIAPDEVSFVREWVEAIRGRGGVLRGAGLLVRPHPQNAAQWAEVELGLPQVVVWPAGGQDPLDIDARRNYFDSLFHSAAVVGINTSALIEAAIVGRTVHTVLAPAFAETQAGTLHFHHLASETGHLQVGSNLREHVEQLERTVAGERDDARGRAFVASFVRPLGLETPAAPIAATAIEAAAARAPAVGAISPVGGALRLGLLGPGLRLADAGLARRRRARSPSKGPRDSEVVRILRRQLRELAGSSADGPILVGPWHSEVGHELLYWIPFLRWALDEAPLLAGRLIAISRGGTSSWYGGVADGYVELYELIAPEKLRTALHGIREETRGKRKQTSELSVDTRLLAQVRHRLGAPDAPALHPSLLFQALRSMQKQPLPPADAPFRHEPLRAPENLELDLPADYVAVRFYESAALPSTPASRRAVRTMLESLSSAGEVVLLAPGGGFDDHDDFDAEPPAGVLRLRPASVENLAVQTAVVAGARAFVGTYGGLCYLAPFLGVPSIGVYGEANFRQEHLALAQRVFAGDQRFGSLAALSLDQLELLPRLLASEPRIGVRADRNG